jgi:hypothetical protein
MGRGIINKQEYPQQDSGLVIEKASMNAECKKTKEV